MIGSTVQRPPALIPVVLLALAAALLVGCGASSLRDNETAADAQAAEAAVSTPTTEATTAATEAADTVETTVSEAAPADNAGAWSVVKDGAQLFAGHLDQANQSVASCQTDAAAGKNFDTCIGAAYTAIATAAGELAVTVDAAVGETDGQCHDALATLHNTTQAMADDYLRAVDMTDLTSRQTLESRLGDDAQTYADTALAAAAACGV